MTDISSTVAKLHAQLAALGDGRDARSENERATYRRDYDTVQRTISGLRNVPDDLQTEQAHLEDWTQRRVAYLAKQADIEQAIADAPDVTAIADARARDRESERQRNLGRQLQLLRNGTLFVAPGVTYGTLDAIDARIAEQRKRCDALQSALDAHVKQAEQLVDAEQPADPVEQPVDETAEQPVETIAEQSLAPSTEAP